jgi:hypothetical protein
MGLLGSTPIALVPDRLYALGGSVALDGRVSWAPALDRRYQAVSCYLLKEGNQALMIDTGLAVHQAAILDQLGTVLPPGSRLRVFVTRPELDSVGNVPSLRETYDVDSLMAGGTPNPFDAFNSADLQRTPAQKTADDSPPSGTGSRVAVGAPSKANARPLDLTSPFQTPGAESILRTKGIDVGERRHVSIITPLLRFMPTYWAFDPTTKTLFTSDAFGYTDQATDLVAEVITSDTDDRLTRKSVALHLFCKYWWLPGARTDRIRDDVVTIISQTDPEIIAPGHGCILKGRNVIQRLISLMVEVLDAC